MNREQRPGSPPCQRIPPLENLCEGSHRNRLTQIFDLSYPSIPPRVHKERRAQAELFLDDSSAHRTSLPSSLHDISKNRASSPSPLFRPATPGILNLSNISTFAILAYGMSQPPYCHIAEKIYDHRSAKSRYHGCLRRAFIQRRGVGVGRSRCRIIRLFPRKKRAVKTCHRVTRPWRCARSMNAPNGPIHKSNESVSFAAVVHQPTESIKQRYRNFPYILRSTICSKAREFFPLMVRFSTHLDMCYIV